MKTRGWVVELYKQLIPCTQYSLKVSCNIIVENKMRRVLNNNNNNKSLRFILITIVLFTIITITISLYFTINNNNKQQNDDDKCSFNKLPSILSGNQISKIIPPYPSISQRINQPHMEQNEIEFFKQTLQRYIVYFEFGMGGSTGLASLQENLKSITTVDNDIHFVVTIRNANLQRVFPFWINTGPIKSWGVPNPENYIENPCHHLWSRYALSYSMLRKPSTDLVFVDGRFRISCVFAVIISGDRPDFLIHDYQEERNYDIVEIVLQRVNCVESLCLFSPKTNINILQVQQLFIKYMNDWEH